MTSQFIRDYGEPVTLRRLTGTAQIPMDIAVRAVVREFDPQQLVGTIQQGDRTVILSNHEIAARRWPGPPRKGDQVVIVGAKMAVQSVETVRIGGEVIRHNLVVRGS